MLAEVPQDEWRARKRVGHEATHSSETVISPTARIVRQGDQVVQPSQLYQIIELYNTLQHRAIDRINNARVETTAAEMIATLEDANDIVLQDAAPTGQPQAYVAQLVDAGFWLAQTEDQQMFVGFPALSDRRWQRSRSVDATPKRVARAVSEHMRRPPQPRAGL